MFSLQHLFLSFLEYFLSTVQYKVVENISYHGFSLLSPPPCDTPSDITGEKKKKKKYIYNLN